MQDASSLYYYVLGKLEEKHKRAQELMTLYKDGCEEIQNVKNNASRILISERLQSITKELEVIDLTSIDSYKLETKDLMKRYNEMGRIKYDFVKGECIGNTEERQEILNQLVAISKSYICFSVDNDIEQKIICKCGTDLTDISVRCAGNLKCYECNATILINNKNVGSKTKTNDSKIKQMEKSIRDFQGKNVKAVSQKVINTIKNYYEDMATKERERGNPSKWCCQKLIVEDISKLSPSERYCSGKDHKALYDALSKTGLSKYNKSINLIGHILFGWELPDISDVEFLFMEFFIKIITAYQSLKKTRSSSLCDGYMKYQTLVLVGKVFPISWFKIVKDPRRIDEYESLWEQSCKKCDDPRIKFIPIPRK